MLVLTLRDDESVEITIPGYKEKIKVSIIHVTPSRTRVGFDAPSDCTILRSELIEEDRSSKKQKYNPAWNPKAFRTNRFGSGIEQ